MNDARREWRERIVNDFRAGRLLLTSVSLNNLLCDAMAVADANPLEQGGVVTYSSHNTVWAAGGRCPVYTLLCYIP